MVKLDEIIDAFDDMWDSNPIFFMFGSIGLFAVMAVIIGVIASVAPWMFIVVLIVCAIIFVKTIIKTVRNNREN